MFDLFDNISKLIVLIPALPLAAAIVTAVAGPRLLKERSHWPTIAAVVAAFFVSLRLLMLVQAEAHKSPTAVVEHTTTVWEWASVPEVGSIGGEVKNFVIGITLRADPLTAIMLAMVTFVGSLIMVYAAGYM